MAVAKRRGRKRAVVEVSRKLAVVLHRIWTDGTHFRAKRRRLTTCRIVVSASRRIDIREDGTGMTALQPL
jgi:hypothetical protein